MKKVLIPLAPGFEEIEAVTLIGVLRRADIEVTTAGTAAGTITGSRNIQIQSDQLLEEINPDDFDMIALPGGAEGVRNLKDHPQMQSILGSFVAGDKPIAAICAAPALLADLGLICGKQVTSHPSVKGKVATAALYSEDRVVVDGKLITSRGPGTAMEFSLKLVELLAGKEKMSELNEGMLAKKA